MKCSKHPEKEASGFCFYCGKPFCSDDLVEIQGKLYSKDFAEIIYIELGVMQSNHVDLNEPLQTHSQNPNEKKYEVVLNAMTNKSFFHIGKIYIAIRKANNLKMSLENSNKAVAMTERLPSIIKSNITYSEAQEISSELVALACIVEINECNITSEGSSQISETKKYRIILQNIVPMSNSKKIDIIKALLKILNLKSFGNLSKIKAMVDSLPTTIKCDITYSEALSIASILNGLGGVVEIQEQNY